MVSQTEGMYLLKQLSFPLFDMPIQLADIVEGFSEVIQDKCRQGHYGAFLIHLTFGFIAMQGCDFSKAASIDLSVEDFMSGRAID